MTGRERFEAALGGRGVAFAPLVWERLPELVHQVADGWWHDPGAGLRLLGDAAALAGADAMFVLAAGEAAAERRRSGATGDDALDALAGTPEAEAGYELVQALRASSTFAVIAALPDAETLRMTFEAADADAADDALCDLARAHLDAGADALAVLGSDGSAVRAAAARVGGVGDFYGCPVLGLCEADAWWERGCDAPLAVMAADGTWPALAAGLVVTPDDVSTRWDADRLHAVGRSHP